MMLYYVVTDNRRGYRPGCFVWAESPEEALALGAKRLSDWLDANPGLGVDVWDAQAMVGTLLFFLLFAGAFFCWAVWAGFRLVDYIKGAV